MKIIKVLLVDDHKIIRDGIKALLADIKNIEFVAEAQNGEEAIAKAEIYEFDIILMDITMPGINGIEATRRIISLKPDAKVLALSMHNDSAYISAMVEAGASGYLLKGSGKEELISAIENVANGNKNFTGEVAEKMVSYYINKKANPNLNPSLSKREIQILQNIANGLTNIEIANKLFISERTVDAHRRNLLQKLHVKNSAEMIKFACANNIINCD
jgi:two-component system nitrate/nitrite response regulator NarL